MALFCVRPRQIFAGSVIFLWVSFAIILALYPALREQSLATIVLHFVSSRIRIAFITQNVTLSMKSFFHIQKTAVGDIVYQIILWIKETYIVNYIF